MEVIEHVAAPPAFMQHCAALLNPGGIMFLATLNRTLKSFALAIVGAEYVLGWLPRGTHDWHKFITPDELDQMANAAGLAITTSTGSAITRCLTAGSAVAIWASIIWAWPRNRHKIRPVNPTLRHHRAGQNGVHAPMRQSGCAPHRLAPNQSPP